MILAVVAQVSNPGAGSLTSLSDIGIGAVIVVLLLGCVVWPMKKLNDQRAAADAAIIASRDSRIKELEQQVRDAAESKAREDRDLRNMLIPRLLTTANVAAQAGAGLGEALRQSSPPADWEVRMDQVAGELKALRDSRDGKV